MNPEYRVWRKAVIERDKRLCRRCHATSNLHVHHIYRFNDKPHLRWDVGNGITLCKKIATKWLQVTNCIGKIIFSTCKPGVKGYYPAFDITPPELVTGVATDIGVLKPTELLNYRVME